MAVSIFLTGGSGFLGRRVLDRLKAQNVRVVCLVRKRPAIRSETIEFIPGELADRDSYSEALRKCDVILHLAAATGKNAPGEYFRVNRDGTAALLLEAKRAGISRFTYVSSIAAGFRDISKYPYAQSKRQAESLVSESGLHWTIIRPTMIFGPESPVLAGLRRLAALPVMPVFGNGRALVQPIFVDDLADVMTATLQDDPGERTFEIGGPEVLSIEELLCRIRGALGIRSRRIVHLPAEPLAAVLEWIEPALRSILPISAGQLASFTNDGVAMPDRAPGEWPAGLRGIDEMLQVLTTNGSA